MVIFYGIRSKAQRSVQTTYNCPHCGKERSIAVVPVWKYAHLFWVPFFPLWKSYVCLCTECDEVVEKTIDMPITKEIKRQTSRLPWWTFSGLIIVALLVGWGVIQSKTRELSAQRDIKAKIENPQVGDVYQVRLDSCKYTLMRATAVRGDSIFVQFHEYYVDKGSDLPKLKRKRGSDYGTGKDFEDFYTREELLEMAGERTLLKIDR
ncbi:hypothetical protein FACS1894159_03850 [Bacteroidia bacterium]|nr:hypothetical protein FACS1894159_03850 [Bacteroidia bacterium]